MKALTPLLLLLSFLCSAQQKDYFDQVNAFLIREVSEGKINYARLKQNPNDLDLLIRQIAKYDLTGKSDNHKLAFYVNAYNLLVIKQVVDHYPIKSPFDVPGFFKETKFQVAGEFITLDQLEFDKLVGPYRDPRIHFALGCAAKSCPFLYDNAFTPEHIQEQLEFRAQLIIDRPNYVSVNQRTKTATLNKIFDWYRDQFSYNAGSLINYINRYRFYKVPADYSVVFEEYDWTLNSQ